MYSTMVLELITQTDPCVKRLGFSGSEATPFPKALAQPFTSSPKHISSFREGALFLLYALDL